MKEESRRRPHVLNAQRRIVLNQLSPDGRECSSALVFSVNSLT